MRKTSFVTRSGHLAFAILFIASCIASPAAPSAVPSPTPTRLANSLGTSAPPAVATSAAAQVQTLRIWLPPQFTPSSETAQGKILAEQIAEFESTQRWKIEVRIKKASGQGGLLNALQTSLQSAPSAAPDVIALESQMLISVSSLLQPIVIPDGADYYPFSIQSVRLGNQLIALPFAADIIGFAYITGANTKPPTAWNEFKRDNGPLWLPLGDPAATITLQQYAALGGQMTDVNGKPFLDAPILAEVLTSYQTMQTNGLLANGSIKAIDTTETWTAYREGRGRLAAVTMSNYLIDRARVTATAFTVMPTRNGNRLAYASQWNYAIITTDPARRAIALELIQHLTAPEQLGAWTFAASVLPPRKNALAVWPDSGVKNIASETLAFIVPTPSTLSALNPHVANAVQAVLNRQLSPEAAAAGAAELVNKK